MGDSVVVIRPGIGMNARVEGKYTVHATPAATNVYCGFVPSKVIITNATDGDAGGSWTTEFAAGTGMDEDGTAIASNGVTTLEDSTGMGFTVGTDANLLEASKVYTFEAFR